jgi:predicted DCC family thiol-disulfide oxidoreductase YuxK
MFATVIRWLQRRFISARGGSEDLGDRYRVTDPGKVKDLFTTTPQQSDYQTTWAAVAAERETGRVRGGLLTRLYRSLVPLPLRDRIYKLRPSTRASHRTHDPGVLDDRHYTRFTHP